MLKVSDEERALYEVLTKDFDDEGGYQTDQRGGKSLRYITGEQCVTRLNHAFGPLGWMFEIRERWYDEEADECCVLGRLTVFRKLSVWHPDNPNPVEMIQPISHEQIGSQKHNRRKTIILTSEDYENYRVYPGQPAKQYQFTKLEDENYRKNDSNEILDTGFDWKGASTDSLKKCASWFGIALELSRKAGRPASASQRPQQARQQPQRPQSQGQQNRPAQSPQSGPAKTFSPPFKSQQVTHKLACRAAGCDIVLEPGVEYAITVGEKDVVQTAEYIMQRSKEEAGTVLCLKHVITYIQAMKDQGIPLKADPSKTTA